MIKTKRSFLDKAWDFSFGLWLATETIFVHSPIAILALVLFMGLTLEQVLVRGKIKLKIPKLFVCYAFFVFVCYLNIWLGYSMNSGLSSALGVTLLRNFLFIMLAYYYIINNDMKRIKKVFVTSIFLGCIFSILLSLLKNGSLLLRGDDSVFNANVLAISAVISICFIVCTEKFKFTCKSFCVILVLALTCVLASTRKALLAGIIILAIYFVLKYPRKLLKNTIVITILLVLVYVAIIKIPFLYDTIGNRIEGMIYMLSGEEGDASSENRSEFIEIGLRYFRRSPWLGNGINCFQSLPMTGTYSHNNYVELLFSVGIVGAFAYYSVFAILLMKATKKYLRDRTLDTILCISMIFALLFIDVALVSYYQRISLLYIIMCFGFLRGDNKNAKEDI